MELVSNGLRKAGTFNKRRTLTFIQTFYLQGSISTMSSNFISEAAVSLKTIFGKIIKR
jgi:hypothetical protein